MKLCIFGADGRTGVEVVKYAHQQAFEVSAFVYSDKQSHYFPEGITIIKGDVMDYNQVYDAIKGSDAVISVIGHIKGSDPLMQTKGIQNIVAAMQALGVKRILSLTGTGARVSGDAPSFLDRILNFAVRLLDPSRIHDGVEHMKVLQNSHLDWTIVRVLKLSTSDECGHSYKLTTGGPAEIQTNRKKVARVLVDLVKNDEYVRVAPVISG
jgi:putative NADH-flavin reductase